MGGREGHSEAMRSLHLRGSEGLRPQLLTRPVQETPAGLEAGRAGRTNVEVVHAGWLANQRRVSPTGASGDEEIAM